MSLVVASGLVALAVLLWPRADAASVPPPSRAGAATAPRRLTELAAVLRGRLGRPDRARILAAEAAYCELLALGLRAGLPPSAALAIADRGTDEDVVSPVEPGRVGRPGSHGSPGPPGSSRPVSGGGSSGLSGRPGSTDPPVPDRGGRLLRLAWVQSEVLGTPLADAVATCAAARQSDHDHELRRRAAAAGPRASMLLLTALPVAGPALASLVGLGPDLGDPVVVGALAAGAGATCVGWWWARHLIARADRPVPVAGPRLRRLSAPRPRAPAAGRGSAVTR